MTLSNSSQTYVFAQLLNEREILSQKITDQSNWIDSIIKVMDNIGPDNLDETHLQNAKDKRDILIRQFDYCEKSISEIETCGCLGKIVTAQPLYIPMKG